MAKFLGTLGEISGKVGNVVFTKGRYGGVLRRRAVPVQPRSPNQRGQRAILSAAATLWRNRISPIGNALAWNEFAKNFPLRSAKGTKAALYVTGAVFSIAINTMRKTLGTTFLLAPPPNWDARQPLGFVATLTGGATLVLTSLDLPVDPAPGDVLLIRATGPLPRGVSYVGKGKYRIVATPLVSALPYDMTNDYIAQYGVIPVSGQKVGIEVQVVRIASNPYNASPQADDTACPSEPISSLQEMT
jgi:hypothetical protein